ncbi:MAG: sigma 54-interacting transcriptional regulator [Myxococcales bacterium]|nr:sigma 54-interacting transcriptional regulator [Myxococcales bacterium]
MSPTSPIARRCPRGSRPSRPRPIRPRSWSTSTPSSPPTCPTSRRACRRASAWATKGSAMPSSELTRTGSRTDSSDDALTALGDQPRLIVALEGERPQVPGLRLSLTDVDEVQIGRGAQRTWSRERRKLLLTLPDHELSRHHAALRRAPGGWELSDLGSKNGTMIAGQPIKTAALADADTIEVGACTLIFREDGAAEPVTDRDLAGEPEVPAGFRSLSTEFERRVRDLAKLAPSNVPILIRGETGTGKEVIARAIHDRSLRRGELMAINCGALPRGLIESELFGHRKGAFSGAHGDRDGLVRRAHGGTLFLDEIAELPEESQVALLRVLQEGEVRPIGGNESVAVDVRIVAATHQDLPRRIGDGRFRQDLYARLAGFEVELPPLRDRLEDLGTLIATMLPHLVPAGADPSTVRIHRTAARALFAYSYPLNIRELEQAVRTALVLADTGELRLEHLAEAIRTAGPRTTGGALRPEDRALRERLIEVLRETNGNVMAASRVMDKAPIQLRRWCRRFAIELADFRR